MSRGEFTMRLDKNDTQQADRDVCCPNVTISTLSLNNSKVIQMIRDAPLAKSEKKIKHLMEGKRRIPEELARSQGTATGANNIRRLLTFPLNQPPHQDYSRRLPAPTVSDLESWPSRGLRRQKLSCGLGVHTPTGPHTHSRQG